MDYRKIISFGKSSYVVSLPKSWVVQNKLGKGDVVYFEENGANLSLQPRSAQEGQAEKSLTNPVDGKNLRRLQRDIISAYIKNYKEIILVGNEIREKAKNIQEFVQSLVALEVMEQDSKKIVTRDFLNMNDISVSQILKKMDVITRSMLRDCTNMFKDDTYESIYHRDNDVNRFRFLIFRIVWFGMENPSWAMKKMDMTMLNLLHLWWLAFSIEAIADHIKRIARYMREIKLNAKSQQEFITFLSELEQTYLEMMKGYYHKNPEVAHQILERRESVIKWCDDFYLQNKSTLYVGYLIQNVKSLIVNIHTIGRMMYQEMT